MRTRLFTFTVVVGLAASAIAAAAAAAGEPQAVAPVSAKWVARKLHFMYSPVSPTFTTTVYSCDGLESQMTSILRQLGASADLSVHATGCVRPSGPEKFPGVDATFSVLEPAETAEHAAGSQSVTAQWDKVTLDSGASCQLLEQVKRNVLPLFVTRNATSACGTAFTVEVLRPIKAPPPQPNK